MNALVPEFLWPISAPTEPYEPNGSVVAWCLSVDASASFFVTRREEGTFGTGVCAWVAWRDAANNVRSHSWHELPNAPSVVASAEAEAKLLLEAYAANQGVALGAWHARPKLRGK